MIQMPPTHILKHKIDDDGMTCRIRCGDTMGDIYITEVGVHIRQRFQHSTKEGKFIFTGRNAMSRAIQACWNPEMKAILTLADSLNH